jgi:hypothetical protein
VVGDGDAHHAVCLSSDRATAMAGTVANLTAEND